MLARENLVGSDLKGSLAAWKSFRRRRLPKQVSRLRGIAKSDNSAALEMTKFHWPGFRQDRAFGLPKSVSRVERSDTAMTLMISKTITAP